MQKSVEIISNNKILRGTIHIPENVNDKFATIIIFHGFQGHRLGPHFMFVHFSRILEQHGFATVRFDFAGSGESDGNFVDMTFSNELTDASNILDYVKSLDFVDTSKIGLVGFSMGGAIASILAGEKPNDIKALSLWSPAGDMYNTATNDFVGDSITELYETGEYEFEGLSIGVEFIKDLEKYNIYKLASKYNNRVLLLHGTEDEIISIDASYNFLDKSYGEKAKLIKVIGADHLFSSQKWKQILYTKTLNFFIGQLV